MTTFQKTVAQRACELARQTGVEISFAENDVGTVWARFYWQELERLVLIDDCQLILEWDGEYYFEVPADPDHVEVRRFLEMFRLCLSGLSADDARRQAVQYVALNDRGHR